MSATTETPEAAAVERLQVAVGAVAPTGHEPGALATTTTVAPTALAAVVVTPPIVPAGLVARARADGVTGPAVIVLSALLVLGGALLDLSRAATLGLATGIAFVVAAVAGPLVIRFRSLPTAVVLPPLLLAGAATVIAAFGGHNNGRREVVLDVGTTLALHAPLLFLGTSAAVVVTVVRVGRWLAGR